MNSFPLFYSIWNHVLYYFPNWHFFLGKMHIHILNFRGMVMTPPWTFLLANLLLKLYTYAKLIHQLVHHYFLNKKNWSVVNKQTETHMECKIQISCLTHMKRREKCKERHNWTRTTSSHRIPPPTADFFILLLISPFTFSRISIFAVYTL